MSTPERVVVPVAELEANAIDLTYRDYCAHLLIPLNKCRKATWYMPWKCEHERHAYEKCQYEDFVARSKKMVKDAN